MLVKVSEMLCNELNIADNEVLWIRHFSDDNRCAQRHFKCSMREFTKKKITNKYTEKFGIFN